MTDNFYEGTSENTRALLIKAQRYVALALELGDSVHMESGTKVVIQLLRSKKEG